MAKCALGSDVVLALVPGGAIASNHRTRTHAWLGAGLVNYLMTGKSDVLSAADLSRFGNIDGLLADPTGLSRCPGYDVKIFESPEAAVAFLRELKLIVDDEGEYADFFQKRTSLLDRAHLGTFHQQVGNMVRLKLREDPDSWWVRQKFDPETGELREGLYKYVQESFLLDFINKLDAAGKTVLDFGCGTGLASEPFIRIGAKVIGVDPNRHFLAQAKQRLGEQFEPVHIDTGDAESLARVRDVRVDYIWMSDVLMFYFYPLDASEPKLRPAAVLRSLSKMLKPGGRLIIMQPHGVFWLAPWLGARKRPFTVLTEYADRLYSVTPSLEQLAHAIDEAGLAIKTIHEPRAHANAPQDERAYQFARQFPVWWVFECVLVP